MRVSCICPTRLATNPAARPEAGDLYLDRALGSVVRNIPDDVELEVLIGIDPGARLPRRFGAAWWQRIVDRTAFEWDRLREPRSRKYRRRIVTKAAYGRKPGQAPAVNAAARLATGDFIMMIEDDDMHRPGKFQVQMNVLSRGYQFCSTTQREIDAFGNFKQTNAFACPSTILMPRETWETVGPFDETFRWHVDTEWLGRLNQACKEKGWRRCHIAHVGAERDGSWLAQVAQFSDIGHDDEITEPLVDRTVHDGSGMAAIRKDAERLAKLYDGPKTQEDFDRWARMNHDTPYAESSLEHQVMISKFGHVPW